MSIYGGFNKIYKETSVTMAISFFTHMTASHFQNATNFKAELSDGIFTFEKCDADSGGAISVALGEEMDLEDFFFFGRRGSVQVIWK